MDLHISPYTRSTTPSVHHTLISHHQNVQWECPRETCGKNRLLRQVEVIGNCQCFIQSLSWNCLRTQLFRRNYSSGPCPKTHAPTQCLKPRTRSYASRLHALLQSKLYKQVLTRTFDQCRKTNKICTISAVNCLTSKRHHTVLRVLAFRGDPRALLCERVSIHFASSITT